MPEEPEEPQEDVCEVDKDRTLGIIEAISDAPSLSMAQREHLEVIRSTIMEGKPILRSDLVFLNILRRRLTR